MMTEYETPIGNITLDTESTFFKNNDILVLKELHSTGEFEWMKKSVDEAEHSIEMQLPYIEKMMQG